MLLTSVGRRVELVRAFRSAFDQLGVAGRIVATDINPLAPALQDVDDWTIVPRYTDPAYIPTLRAICEREGVTLVFPLIDPDIAILAEHRETLEATGARLMVVPLESARITEDKWRTHAFFAELGLPVARAWLPDDPALEDAELPLFIKPRQGSASQNTFKVRTRDELAFFSRYVPLPIIQEFLPGPEITNDVLCNHEGKVLAVVSRRRIEVRGGEVSKGVTIHDEGIAEACIAVARGLSAVGPITVQCMMRDGVPHFTEVNARFGGGLPLGIAAGVNAPYLLFASLLGRLDAAAPLASYQSGIYLTRFDDSYFLSEQDREQMASHRL